MKLDELAVDVLAVARITRLVTADTITEPWRKRFVGFVLDRRSSTGGYTTLLLGRSATSSTAREAPLEVDEAFDRYEEAEGRDVPKAAVLVTCPWCVSVYAAVFVTAARRTAPRAWQRAARLLAAAQLGGHVAALTM